MLISAFVFAAWIVQFLLYFYPNFKILALVCICTGRFFSDLVGNPEDRFPHDGAHLFLQAGMKDEQLTLVPQSEAAALYSDVPFIDVNPDNSMSRESDGKKMIVDLRGLFYFYHLKRANCSISLC